MATPIKTITATINGQTYTLTWSDSANAYQAKVTAPSGSSFNLDGQYYPVTVTAEDNAGNITTIDDKTETLGQNLRAFVYERIKPTAVITSPSEGAYVTTARPEISFIVKDNNNGQATGYSGIDKSTLVVKVNGSPLDASGVVWQAVDGGYIGTLAPTIDIPDGLTTVSVDIKDNDSNEATTAVANFTVDTLAPSLNITAPIDGLETNKSLLVITGVTDDITSKPVTVSIKLNEVDQGAVFVDDNGNFRKEVNLTTQGENIIVVRATDHAGKSEEVVRTVVYDTMPPIIRNVYINPNPIEAGGIFTITVEVE